MPRSTLVLSLTLLGLAPLVHAGDPGPAETARTHAVRGPHVGSHGGTVIVTARGPLVAERNAGALVRTDSAGGPIAVLELGGELGELVHDGHGRVFAADRGGDRIVEIIDGDTLALGNTAAVAEPYGLALTPDGGTLLVTSVAEHALVAIATADLTERWRVELAAEPRGVAVAPDGEKAVVGFLSRGSLAVIDLVGTAHAVRWQGLDPRDQMTVVEDEEFGGSFAELREAPSRFRVPQGAGRRYARSAFAVAYLGDGRAVTTHQLATPQLVHKPRAEDEDSYGGAAVETPRIVHQLAWIAEPGGAAAHHDAATIGVHQPRAIGYDVTADTLFVAGYGDDRIVAVADATQPTPWVQWTVDLGGRAKPCGIDGLVVDGTTLRVHCELSRRLVSVPTGDGIRSDRKREQLAVRGPELAPSLRSPLIERGAELFRRADDARLSDGGTMACASCHPEGRADGLTWRLGAHVLQTPMLAGRVVGTAPYKWDGQDPSLRDSLRHTIDRLGGDSGLVSRADIAALEAYVASLPAPRGPRIIDDAAHTRGKALFADATLGCASCHSGATLTDGAQYPLRGNLEQTDTPSLVGLAHSAPYYHDGSAETLHALLTDRGSIHDMAELGGLADRDVADLRVYLESL